MRESPSRTELSSKKDCFLSIWAYGQVSGTTNNSHPHYVRQLETLFKMASKLSISAVNGLDYGDFIQRFGNVVENTSLCAAAVCARRPFYSFDSFVSSMYQFIDELPKDGRAGILRSHPDLADRLESLTPESQREQTHAGITTLNEEEIQQLKHYNRLYKEKFGFPFVICARLNKKDAILGGIQTRLHNDDDQELQCGIEEVKKIMLLRMKDLLECEDSKL